MKINKTIAIVVVLLGLLVGGLGAGIFLIQRPQSVNAAPLAQQVVTCNDDDDIQHEAENEANDSTEADACPEENEANEAEEANGVDEADEAATLQGQAGITADEAQAAVEAANPGVKTLAVELDNENGTIIYEVELDNGHDVKVDATNGNILGTDQRDAD